MNHPPNDRRHFVHKRLIGAIGGGLKGILGGGGPLSIIGGAARGFAGGGRKSRARVSQPQVLVHQAPERVPVRRPPPRTVTARPSEFSSREKEAGRQAKFAEPQPLSIGAGGGCVWPMRRDPRTGRCKIFLGTQSGRDDEPIPQSFGPRGGGGGGGAITGDVGEAVMGRYGAAMVPGNQVVDRAVCLPGMQLGNDGLCYNRGTITNRQRQWPKGRKPLLTGGEMRAIAIAATAGRRLERTTKRLQKIGLMKKPSRSRRPPKSGAHAHG